MGDVDLHQGVGVPVAPEFPLPLEEETETVSFVASVAVEVTVGSAGGLILPEPLEPPPPEAEPVS